MKEKILITGGAGYIGSQLAKQLIALRFSVVIVDNLSYGKEANIPHGTETFYKTDICSPDLMDIMKKEQPYMVFHLAASKSVNESLTKPIDFAKTNILGSLNVINSTYAAGVKRLVFTSTAGVYGDFFTNGVQVESQKTHPSSPYGWTKQTIEDYIAYMNIYNNTEYIVLRFANVYGPGGESLYKSAIDIFTEKMLKSVPITIHGDGTQTRDFIFIDDLITICIALVGVDVSSITEDLVFNVSTGSEITINEVIKHIASLTNSLSKVTYDTTIFAGQERSILDTTKTKKVLDWKAKVTLQEGIQKIINSYKNTYEK